MKYIVVKGLLGFGDRLEHLKMCVKFAIENKLIIHVDWTDGDWSHGEESFYKYFDLIGVEQVKNIDDIPSDLKVYPAFFQNNLKHILTLDDAQGRTPATAINLGMLNKSKIPETDILVSSNVGDRWLYADSEWFSNNLRVIDPRILNKVRERYTKYDLPTALGCHLRGTDRTSRRRHPALLIQNLILNSLSRGLLDSKNVVVVSDDIDLITAWKQRIPHSKIISEDSLIESDKIGNHNKKSLNTTKDQLNVDMLCDFFTLTLCKNIAINIRDSRFGAEAKRLHSHTKRILNF